MPGADPKHRWTVKTTPMRVFFLREASGTCPAICKLLREIDLEWEDVVLGAVGTAVLTR